MYQEVTDKIKPRTKLKALHSNGFKVLEGNSRTNVLSVRKIVEFSRLHLPDLTELVINFESTPTKRSSRSAGALVINYLTELVTKVKSALTQLFSHFEGVLVTKVETSFYGIGYQFQIYANKKF